MPAEAGIQSIGDNDYFKNLDSRSLLKACRNKLCGNDGIFSAATHSREGEGKIGFRACLATSQKIASTKSRALNSRRSSAFSPIPM